MRGRSEASSGEAAVLRTTDGVYEAWGAGQVQGVAWHARRWGVRVMVSLRDSIMWSRRTAWRGINPMEGRNIWHGMCDFLCQDAKPGV